MTLRVSSRPACIPVGVAPDELHLGPGNTNGSVAHVLYCAADAAVDPLMRRRVVVFHGLCQLALFPASAVARSVPVSGSSVRVSTPPRALQSSCARSMFGLCPLKSDRNASSGRLASVAARLVPQPRCFSCACTRLASRRLAGPAGFRFIRVFTSVLHVGVLGWGYRPSNRIAPVLMLLPSSLWLGPQPAVWNAAGRAPLLRRARELCSTAVLRARGFGVPDALACSCVPARKFSILLAWRAGFCYLFRHRAGSFPVTACSPWGSDAPRCRIRGGAEMTEVAESIAFLRERIAGLERQRACLARALEALQDESPPPVRASPPALDGVSAPEERPTLATQILDVLRMSGPLNRRQFLRAFENTDVKAGTLDSAIYRLKERGLVDKRGDRFSVAGSEGTAAGSAAEVVAPPSSASDRSSGPVGGAVEPGAPQVPGDLRVVPVAEDRARAAVAPPDPVLEEDNAVSFTAKVYEAAVTGVAGTRSVMVQHFVQQGFEESAVDSALSDLRRRRKLKSGGRGVIVVVGSDASPRTANAKSQGS